MRFLIRVYCKQHKQNVGSIGGSYRFKPADVGNGGWTELDTTDLWCPTADGAKHDYVIQTQVGQG